MQHRRPAYIKQINSRVSGDEMFVDLTIYDIPGSLLKEFGEKVVRTRYPAGVNEAIKDMLRKAVSEERANGHSEANAPLI